MDPHEDLVSNNRAHIDAHQAEIASLAAGDNLDTAAVEIAPEDQAVLDAKAAVVEAQNALTDAQQKAYAAKIEREKQAELDAQSASEEEKEDPVDEPFVEPNTQSNDQVLPA